MAFILWKCFVSSLLCDLRASTKQALLHTERNPFYLICLFKFVPCTFMIFIKPNINNVLLVNIWRV